MGILEFTEVPPLQPGEMRLDPASHDVMTACEDKPEAIQSQLARAFGEAAAVEYLEVTGTKPSPDADHATKPLVANMVEVYGPPMMQMFASGFAHVVSGGELQPEAQVFLQGSNQ